MTDYKNVVRGNSEIPISSCPAYIADRLYGSGNAVPNEAEQTAFDGVLEKLEEAAEKRGGKRKQKQRKEETRADRIRRIRNDHPKAAFHFLTVDTDNSFGFRGEIYVIDETVAEYKPKNVGNDLLYDMDKIIVVEDLERNIFYFTQDAVEIDKEKIKKFFKP